MCSDTQQSVSDWLRQLEDGDYDAAQQLWDRYFDKLLQQAENRMRNIPPGGIGPEDIAVSVFESLWRGARAGRFQNVRNRDELWWLLLALTHRKVVNHIRHATNVTNGGGIVPMSLSHNDGDGYTFAELVADDFPPDYWVSFEEEYLRLLALLREEQLRKIAVLRLEGFTNREISQQAGVSESTVSRKLKLIRKTWSRELDQ